MPRIDGPGGPPATCRPNQTHGTSCSDLTGIYRRRCLAMSDPLQNKYLNIMGAGDRELTDAQQTWYNNNIYNETTNQPAPMCGGSVTENCKVYGAEGDMIFLTLDFSNLEGPPIEPSTLRDKYMGLNSHERNFYSQPPAPNNWLPGDCDRSLCVGSRLDRVADDTASHRLGISASDVSLYCTDSGNEHINAQKNEICDTLHQRGLDVDQWGMNDEQRKTYLNIPNSQQRLVFEREIHKQTGALENLVLVLRL